MLKALECVGFENCFIKWVQILNYAPCHTFWQTLTNLNLLSCLGAPLLFDITLEPLALGIRNHPLIHRIKTRDNEAMVSLYANDLLIYLSDTAKSVPRLLNYISAFSKIFGYTINWTKSACMSLFTPKILVNLIPCFSRLSKTTSHFLV